MRGVLRFAVLCLLCTQVYSACDCTSEELQDLDLDEGTCFALNKCIENCKTNTHKTLVYAFIVNKTQTSKSCNSLAFWCNELCRDSWSKLGKKAADPPPKREQPKASSRKQPKSAPPEPPAEPLAEPLAEPGFIDSIVNAAVSAALDNFITKAISGVFATISDAISAGLMWLYKVFTYWVFPLLISCLAVVLCFANIVRPGFIPCTHCYPDVVLVGLWIFAMVHLFCFKSGAYFTTDLFFLTWGRLWPRNNQNTNGDTNTTTTTTTNNKFEGCQVQINNYNGVNQNPSTATRMLEGPRTPNLMIPLHSTPKTEVPVDKARVPVKDKVPVAKAPVSVKTEVPVKAEGPVAKAAESKLNVAATTANPVVLSMYPKAIFNNMLDVVKNLCKRERESDEETEAQHPCKKPKQQLNYENCTVKELKAMLDEAKVSYKKSGLLKAKYVELAKAHL